MHSNNEGGKRKISQKSPPIDSSKRQEIIIMVLLNGMPQRELSFPIAVGHTL